MKKVLVVGSHTAFLHWKLTKPNELRVRQIRHIASPVHAVGLVAESGDQVVVLHDANLEALEILSRRGFIIERRQPA